MHHVDVAPTLLKLAGMDVPYGVRGLALGELIAKERVFPDRVVYADVGIEATAYQGTEFTRRIIEGPPIGAGTYRWTSTKSWEAVGPSSVGNPASCSRICEIPTRSHARRQR